MNKLTVVRAEDWEGLFLNNDLIDEGHELHEDRHFLLYAKRVLDKYSPCEVDVKWVTNDYYKNYLSRYGSFPQKLEDVETE